MKKIALFGAGRIGRIHASNAAALAGVELVAVSDPHADSAQALAQTHGARVSTPEAIFADPDIAAVMICSPTTTHSDLITRAAQAGKHIFCEKPVDLSVDRAKACADVVAAQGMDQGEIGQPEMLVITSRDPGAPPVDYIRQSGGIFRDMLIHDFDVFRWILCSDGDHAVWLSATGSCLVDPAIAQAGDMDSTAVTIKTAKGRLCQINTSRRAAYGYDQRFEILGSKGLLQCGNHQPTQVTLANAQGTHSDNPEAFFLERYKDAYRLELEHFFSTLQHGGTFRTTVQDGVLAQGLADAAAHSAATGQAVVMN